MTSLLDGPKDKVVIIHTIDDIAEKHVRVTNNLTITPGKRQALKRKGCLGELFWGSTLASLAFGSAQREHKVELVMCFARSYHCALCAHFNVALEHSLLALHAR